MNEGNYEGNDDNNKVHNCGIVDGDNGDQVAVITMLVQVMPILMPRSFQQNPQNVTIFKSMDVLCLHLAT